MNFTQIRVLEVLGLTVELGVEGGTLAHAILPTSLALRPSLTPYTNTAKVGEYPVDADTLHQSDSHTQPTLFRTSSVCVSSRLSIEYNLPNFDLEYKGEISTGNTIINNAGSTFS